MIVIEENYMAKKVKISNRILEMLEKGYTCYQHKPDGSKNRLYVITFADLGDKLSCILKTSYITPGGIARGDDIKYDLILSKNELSKIVLPSDFDKMIINKWLTL